VRDAAPRSRRFELAWLLWGAALVALAIGVRLAWVLVVPTVPVSDFAMYRESANYLSEFRALDPGFIYMPGFVALLAWVKDAGGDLFAQKLLGVGFGGLGAAGIFLCTRGLVDGAAEAGPGGAGPPARWRRLCPCPAAAGATLVSSLWPAGVAMASVVGTDVPAAALLVTALGLLVTLGPRRPVTGALAFGVTMGLAAWVRAVALPLSALALGYWLARREKPWRAAALTAIGVAATFVVLLPWGVRHLRQSGTLYFTDDHGGITALIGANPNSEGTYTRALNQLFKDVTGRGVLDEPHRQTDRAAYEMARSWQRFEPGYALGLGFLKADRLYDPEHRLLYWSVLRPGVLVGRPAAFVAAHRRAITGLADGFGLALAGLALAGVALAVARRRFTLLSLVPFQLALTATYALFFAEPRYRLPIEMLAFPFAALAAGALALAFAALARRSRAGLVQAARTLGPALVVVVTWRFGWPFALDAGAALRARHRWAVTEVAVDGRMRTLLWGPAPPLAPTSPLEGAPNGVHLRLGPAAVARARLLLGGGDLSPGTYALRLRLEADGGPARFALGGAEAGGAAPSEIEVHPGSPAVLETRVAHPGGPLALEATARSPAPGSVWAAQATISTLR
jgi:hypothetical protein